MFFWKTSDPTVMGAPRIGSVFERLSACASSMSAPSVAPAVHSGTSAKFPVARSLGLAPAPVTSPRGETCTWRTWQHAAFMLRRGPLVNSSCLGEKDDSTTLL